MPGDRPIDGLSDGDEFGELSDLPTGESDDEPVQAMPGVNVRPTNPVADEIPADDSEKGLVDRLRPSARRAGEQETLKSPLVLGLAGGTLVLLLVSAAFFVSLGQNTVRGLFDEADAEVAEGRYTQAIEHLDQFLKLYPSHDEYTPKATFLMYSAKIEAEVSGSVPDWKKGLVAVTNTSRRPAILRDSMKRNRNISSARLSRLVCMRLKRRASRSETQSGDASCCRRAARP